MGRLCDGVPILRESLCVGSACHKEEAIPTTPKQSSPEDGNWARAERMVGAQNYRVIQGLPARFLLASGCSQKAH